MSYKRRECLQQLKLPQTVTVVQIHSSRAHACKHMCVCTLDIVTTITSCPILPILRILNSLLKGNERQANFKFPVLGGLGGSTNLHTLIITQVQEPVRLVRFWPDHFFDDLMKFITDICACAITDAVPYACAYYRRITSKVLPMPLYYIVVYLIHIPVVSVLCKAVQAPQMHAS